MHCDLKGHAKDWTPQESLGPDPGRGKALIRLMKLACVNRSLAFRARLVLACADGTLNSAVERFFGMLTEKALRAARVPASRHCATRSLRAWVAHNEKTKPFTWTKTADEILDKISRVSSASIVGGRTRQRGCDL